MALQNSDYGTKRNTPNKTSTESTTKYRTNKKTRIKRILFNVKQCRNFIPH